jgi:pyruvate/2-oxoglutarate dehydrogenase complex dihydrolipoamide dehydrogenase (E3) component
MFVCAAPTFQYIYNIYGSECAFRFSCLVCVCFCFCSYDSTHYAGFQGAIAARNILLPLTDPGVITDIPATTFTSPEIASLGYTEAEARAAFGDEAVAVSSKRLDQVDRAMCDGETKGILKVIYHKRNGKILGATMMCPAGGELISEIAVAKHANMAFADLAKVIHPYPSYAIALQIMAADVYYEKTMKLKWLYAILKRIGL